MKGKHTHDSHIKKLLSSNERAIAYFREYLPKSMVEELKLNDLQLIDKSFVGKNNKQFHADLLFSIPGKRQNILIYVLFEHKSYYDTEIFGQLLSYLSSVYKWQMSRLNSMDKNKNLAKKNLDVVVPFVFYHGKEKWDLGFQFLEYFPKNLNSEFIKYIPNFDIHLFHLSETSEISNRLPDYLYYNLQVMQVIRRSRKDIVYWLESLIEGSKNNKNNSNFIAICRDIIEYLEGTVEDSRSIIDEVQEKEERFFMGMFAELEAKAIERGMAKGMEKGMEKGAILTKLATARKLMAKGMNRLDILEITGLTERDLIEEGID